MKKRVTAYCRVSTDKDDQLNSLENQEQFFLDYINSNPSWEYVPLYVDEGLSGTSTKKRKSFNKMITDAQTGCFDMILTKEVSRFARNTVDTLHYTRQLKSIGVGVRFINDNLDSLDKDGEFRLTIMASVAQEESRKTSERVKWGQRQSMKNGTVFGNKCLGYTINGGKLTIDPKTADIVKSIFHAYLIQGKGLGTIAKELEEQGILTSVNGKRWDATSVKRILTNEKYCGDLKQMKSFTADYLEQKPRRNKGEVDFVLVMDNHDAIIDRNTFDATQAEIKRRGNKESEGKRYTNRYPFSGKLTCGCCDSSFISRNRMAKDKIRVIQRWQCSRYYKYGAKHNDPRGCEASMVRNEILEHVFQLALSDVDMNKDKIAGDCVKLVLGVLDVDDAKDAHAETLNEIADIDKQIERAIGLCVKGIINEEELAMQREPLDKQKTALYNKLSALDNNMSMISESEALLRNIQDRINKIVSTESFSGEVAKEMLEKIVIHSKDRYDVYFRGFDANFQRAV